MSRDVLSDDPIERAIALQERSDAVANDLALAPSGVLLKHINDDWVILAPDDTEADRLVASGEYRPFLPGNGYSTDGTLTCGADPEWIEFGRKERIAALARLMSIDEGERSIRDDIEAVVARIASMTDEEREALERELVSPALGVSAGLVRPAIEIGD